MATPNTQPKNSNPLADIESQLVDIETELSIKWQRDSERLEYLLEAISRASQEAHACGERIGVFEAAVLKAVRDITEGA
jgi:hypothetical protein